MGRRHEQVPSTLRYKRGLLMDCWDRFFFDYPEMEPPGREEAVKRALQRTEERKLAKECRKPSRRGRSGGR